MTTTRLPRDSMGGLLLSTGWDLRFLLNFPRFSKERVELGFGAGSLIEEFFAFDLRTEIMVRTC